MQFWNSKGLQESLFIISFKPHLLSTLNKVKTFQQDINFRFDILFLPCHTDQLAEKQGDSSKNEISKLPSSGYAFLVSGGAQLLAPCL